MKWLYNIKISVKLLVGFMLVGIIAAAIGIMGITKINTVNNLDKELYENMTAPFDELVGVTNDYQYMKLYVRDTILSKNQAEVLEYIAKFNEKNTGFDKELKVFEESLLTEQGKKLSQEIQTLKDTYVLNSNQVMALAKEGKSEDALILIRGEGVRLANEVEAHLKELKDFKLELAKEASVKNDNTAKNAIYTTIIMSIIGVAFATVLGILISISICKPVKKLMSFANEVAQGNLDVTVNIDTKDEIGILANAFRKMTDNLNEVMGNINIAAEQVATGSRQVSDSSMALSQGATQQASSIQELTASIEEIASQTRLNAEHANEANKLAEAAKEHAAQGNLQMKEMQNAMKEINESSSSIYKIIKVIDEIAFQTNILALNAAVEAARAGQHGKGFAVVAEEVRNLAARSANAAKETTAMIESSIKKVEGGTYIANETALALKKIVEGVERAADLVSDIALACSEQAMGIEQINQGIIQVSTVVQTNSGTSEESASSSQELSTQAELLKKQVARFTLKKGTRYTSSYREIDGINEEVLKLIENLSSRKQVINESYNQEKKSHPTKISLSDNEFGKY